MHGTTTNVAIGTPRVSGFRKAKKVRWCVVGHTVDGTSGEEGLDVWPYGCRDNGDHGDDGSTRVYSAPAEDSAEEGGEITMGPVMGLAMLDVVRRSWCRGWHSRLNYSKANNGDCEAE